MSQLPKAPLVEVIFEIKWDINNKAELIDFQYLHGDLYSILKDKYSIRENLFPPEVPIEALRGMPIFRYKNPEKGHPLIQIGPGILSINTVNEFYVWEDFRDNINDVINKLNTIYPKINNLKIIPALVYIDFFNINKEDINSFDFINEKFNINIKSDFLIDLEKQISDVNVSLNYKVGENSLSLNIVDGKINNSTDGLVLQTKVFGKKDIYNETQLKGWLNSSHDLSSSAFKSVVKEDFYKTFK